MSDAVDVAAVHATILAIAVAVAALWLERLLERLDDQRFEVIRAAEAVNDLPFGGTYVAMDSADRDGLRRKFAPSTREERRELVAMIGRAERGALAGPPRDWPPAEIEKVALEAITRLSTAHPFRERVRVSDDGQRLEAVDAERLFGDIDEVRAWLEDLEDLLDEIPNHVPQGTSRLRGGILQAMHANAFAGSEDPIEFPDGVAPSDRERMTRQLFEQRAQTAQSAVAAMSPMVHAFFAAIDGAQQIKARTRAALRRYDASAEHWPPRFSAPLVATFALMLVAGVVVPVAAPGSPRFVYAWLPSIVYVAGLVALLLWMHGRAPAARVRDGLVSRTRSLARRAKAAVRSRRERR